MIANLKNHRGELIALCLLLLVTLLSARVFFKNVFFPTHDLEYHIIRLWQFDQNIRSSVIVPRWASDLNYGYGVPLFSFFYPLPNYVAQTFLLFGFSYIEAVYSACAAGFMLSAFSFYWFARQFYRVVASAIAALFYLLAPYHLLDVYIRGSTGEVWVLALAPLVFGFTTILIRKNKFDSTISLLSLSCACMLLSHTILGITFFVGGILYAFIYALIHKKLHAKTIILIVASYGIGLLLTAYFYIPILFESTYIRGLEIMSVSDHFLLPYQLVLPSWGTGFSVPGPDDSISFQIGIPHLIVFCIALVLSIKKRNKEIGMWLIGTVITIFLMLYYSKSIWEHMSFMNFFQFPWRLLSVVIFCISFMAGFVIESMRKKYVIILTVLLFLCYFQYTYPVTYKKRQDEFYLSNPDWTNSTATLANSFNTIWFSRPEKTDSESLPHRMIRLEYKTPVKQFYTISSDENIMFTPHLSYFPGWEAKINGITTEITNNNGVVSFAVPAGTHTVMLELLHTPAQSQGVLYSFIAIGSLVGIAVLSYARRN